MKKLKTSEEWWADTKADPARLRAWLLDQYRGEVTAAGRIERLRDTYASPGTRAPRLLGVIASQERRHAAWVAELLAARGIAVVVEDKQDRYWRRALAPIHDLETGCAAGAHAEAMRLERIAVIAADEAAPADIRGVFARILPQERFHERAFRALAGEDALAATRAAHTLGRTALGLSA